jgi:hypothetical protein
MAQLRADRAVAIEQLDREALASLVADGLAAVTESTATLPP